MTLTVNGEVIDDAVIREEARLLRPRYEEMITGLDPIQAEMQLRDWSRENVIERVLLRQEAMKDPEPVPPETIQAAVERMKTEAGGQVGCGSRTSDDDLRKEAEMRLRIERLVSRIGSQVSRPKNKEISDYYKNHQDRFWTPELVHAKHIVKNVDELHDEASARAAIEAAEAEIKSGAAFEEVADRMSDCPGRGGDLDWFPRGQMVNEFDAVVFQSQPGTTSPIFRTGFGFHIARVYGRKPAGILPFSDVRDQIEQAILGERREQALADFLDAARERAVILQGSKVLA
jgi:hypothetical protein